MNYPKMTGNAGQAGFSLLEIVIALTIMAGIVLFVSRLASDNQLVANDVTAKMAVSQARLATSQCWSIYGHEGAQVVSVSSGIEGIECTTSSGEGTGRIMVRLPEGVKASLNASNRSIEQLGAYHERGSKSGSSSTDRTTFCLNEDESISAADNLSSCPVIPAGAVQ